MKIENAMQNNLDKQYSYLKLGFLKKNIYHKDKIFYKYIQLINL